MKNIKNYYIYLFISTITRNIIDVYSIIYLYEIDFSIKDIIYIYIIVYFLGIYLSKMFLIIGNKIGYKYILMLSSIITSFTIYIVNYSHNVYLIAIFLSLSMFTYHPIKHYYGMHFLKHKKNIGNMLIIIYIAMFLSSFIAIKKVNIIYSIIISIIGIIPALYIYKDRKEKIIYPKSIPQTKINFFIFDQFKIIFLLLEPLYLYLISTNIKYVATFNIVLTISSVICIYLLVCRFNLNRNYKYLNILFTIILILKINIINKNILLLIAFLEGIGIKTNELVSTINLYDYKEHNLGYLITAEKYFCLIRTIILSVIYLLPISIKTNLYLLIIGIFILSFQYKKNST